MDENIDFGTIVLILDKFKIFTQGVTYYFRYYNFEITPMCGGYALSEIIKYLENNLCKFDSDPLVKNTCITYANVLTTARNNILHEIGKAAKKNSNIRNSIKYFKNYLIREGVLRVENGICYF
jgi:hypothetical protein